MDQENTQEVPKNEPEVDNALIESQKKADEYLNNWKRATADLINYKKEETGRMSLLVNYAKESMLDNILPVLDTIYLAKQHMPEEIKKSEWMMGFSQVEKQIQEFLKKEGIEEIEVLGKPFDPNTMEIVSEVEGGDAGTIIEELQKGYKIGDKIIRPAKVKVSK